MFGIDITLAIIIVLVIIVIYLWKQVEEPYLVLFYKPTCPACIKMKPEWAKFKQLSNKYREIDISNGKPSDFNFNTVPSIFLVTPKYRKKYEGDRLAIEFLTFLKGD
jgi:thiol-disulfide isomerase/thioredoxin